MKVTVAVLDKQGDNVVDRVLEVLNALGDGQTSHFGLVSPKKSVFEKSLGIHEEAGLRFINFSRLCFLETYVGERL